MAKVTFEMEIEPEEVAQAVDALKDIVEAFEFPEYVIQSKVADTMHTTCGGAARGSVNLPAVELDVDTRAFLESLCGTACDDEEEDETDPCIILPGMVVELQNGLVYQVFSIDADGRVILDQLEELGQEDEDHFLS